MMSPDPVSPKSADGSDQNVYNPDPRVVLELSAEAAGEGYAALAAAIAGLLSQKPKAAGRRPVVCLDLYQAPDMDRFVDQLRAAWESAYGRTDWVDTRRAFKDPATLAVELQEFLTGDPVFGRVCDRDLGLFFEPGRWQALLEEVAAATGPRAGPLEPEREAVQPLFITGPGALLSPLRRYSDAGVYAMVARETIFFASEAGMFLCRLAGPGQASQ
jgi:hypothetical protein